MKAASHTLQHVGEWKVELTGATAEDLFAELALVLAGAAGGDDRSAGAPVRDLEWRQVELAARDHATLLVDWANELIGLSEVEQRAYGHVRTLTLELLAGAAAAVRLRAEIGGREVQEWLSPVKAATYHGAAVEHDGAWRGVVLLDV